ncbi:cytochrome P450 20A1 isoform X1 [Lingula anatina]|uniref:Cytochrome P450 20A1 isoform X1 n=1 Tax=Lingula anatina TaxID=7574 RepID=A0A1S3H3Z3_LINAN|nr:cytochrome P450 20A1 isoform X1 [Lingula anatina]|eukprot:XP_013380186.1 cytochrome P450 20A1 isoform X1 [Lingula anatina]
MTDYTFTIIAGLVVILLALVSLYWSNYKSRQTSTVQGSEKIPGLKPKHPKQGNLDDVKAHRSMQEFLVWLHQEFGPVAKFWYGEQFVVSVASPELLKQHGNLFDRPDLFLKSAEAILEPQSVQFTNGEEGRRRRRIYDKCYSHAIVMDFLPTVQQHCEELIERWAGYPPGQHIDCSEEGQEIIVKIAAENAIGADFFQDEQHLKELVRALKTADKDLTDRLLDSQRGSSVEFENAKKYIFSAVKTAVDRRKSGIRPPSGGQVLDAMLENNLPVHVILSDLVTMIFGGMITPLNSEFEFMMKEIKMVNKKS